jgi:hypothetical protein
MTTTDDRIATLIHRNAAEADKLRNDGLRFATACYKAAAIAEAQTPQAMLKTVREAKAWVLETYGWDPILRYLEEHEQKILQRFEKRAVS